MFPPSWDNAAPNAAPCWLAMATVADSSSQRLRVVRSYRHNPRARAVGSTTTSRSHQRSRSSASSRTRSAPRVRASTTCGSAVLVVLIGSSFDENRPRGVQGFPPVGNEAVPLAPSPPVEEDGGQRYPETGHHR